MSIFLKPIGGSYLLVALASVAVLALTIWAYRAQLRSSSGAWRWVAFGLRIAAVLLCLVAALRPSLMIDEKKKQQSVVIFMIDSSESMTTADEVGGQPRWVVAKKALDLGLKSIDGKSKDLDVKAFRFDTDLRDYKADDVKGPDGRETDLGSMLQKLVKDTQGSRIAAIVLLSDGASNGGISPVAAAQQLRAQTIPVVTVGVGTPDAGKASKDVAARDLVAGSVVFVKNQPEIRGTISARGYENQTVEVELYVDQETRPVATKSIKVPEGAEVIQVAGLKYIPDTPGEKRLKLKVKPMAGEQVLTNNEVSTYLDVLKGGLKVLYIQGPDFSWEPSRLVRQLDAAREIHVDLRVLREPARGDRSQLDDTDLAPGQYDVFILGGLPAAQLTRAQIHALTIAVTEKGAGLIMLGGRSSFGPGGWGSTELAKILPVEVSPNDGEREPEEGLKFVPDVLGLENYVLKLGPTPAETARIWDALPPITGTNLFGQPKPSAIVLARAKGARDVPLLIAMNNAGKGRSLAFGGETWPWARSFEDLGRVAHARFWRQAILWLARKEDQGENEVKLKLDSRRVSVGQRLDITATARDSKHELILDAEFPTTVTKLDADGKPEGKPEPVPVFPQGNESKGTYIALGSPGEYEVVVKGTRANKEIGSDRARFMVYQDNRELENPAADLNLLKQISEITGGTALRSEELGQHLKTLSPEASDYVFQSEHRLWDNWPFFLIFAALLTAEWALRKAKGWV
jgi:Putative glutamine amidotransferase/von Willebrand factor type A domain